MRRNASIKTHGFEIETAAREIGISAISEPRERKHELSGARTAWQCYVAITLESLA